ncbi:MAG: YciI family protein [Devosia sp.]
MQYLLLIHGDESRFSQAQDAPVNPQMQAYVAALNKAGVMLGGERLKPSRATRRVSVREGKTRVIDGPYSDTREQLGGYFLLEVADEDAALDWAAKCPAAEHGTIEVRAIVPTPRY